MLRRGWDLLKIKPTWATFSLTIILAGINLVLLGGTFQKEKLTRRLEVHAEELKANMELLREKENEGLQILEDELASAEAHLASLKVSLADTGAAFDPYRQIYKLADTCNVELTSIHRLEGTTQSTVAGTFDMTTYSVNSTGNPGECLSLLSRLESEGLQSLALDHILIDPPSTVCNFYVIMASVIMLDTP